MAKTKILTHKEALAQFESSERFHVIHFGREIPAGVVSITHHETRPYRKTVLAWAKRLKATSVYVCDDKLETMDIYEPNPNTPGSWTCIQKPYSKEVN